MIKKYLTYDLKITEQYAAWAAANLCAPRKTSPEIKDVIFNDPATIVFWSDGTKTVVKAQDEAFDPEKGLAMAITKKVYGNKGNYFNKIKKWLKKGSETKVLDFGAAMRRERDRLDREKLDSLYRLLRDVQECKKSTKAELGVAIEIAVNRIGQVLDD